MEGDRCLAGEAALARGAWEEARRHFDAALAEAETAEALEGLGWVGWWLGDMEATFANREKAYRIHRQAGDRCGAARMASWLAMDSLDFRGDHAVGAGWLGRARSLLDGQPPCQEQGWLSLFDGYYEVKVKGDTEAAAALGRDTAALGHELGVADLEALGRALEGDALVVGGKIEEGMRCIDEAAALAASEEFELSVSPIFTQCIMIGACELAGDFGRVAQWCEAMRLEGERLNGRHVIGVCRSAYGNVLTARGEWPQAEAELTDALGALEATRPGLAPAGLVRLGELRVRQGRTEEARALFERAVPAPLALTGLGALALQDGDAQRAAEIAERLLRRGPVAPLDRVAPLELLARARARLGEPDAARAALEDLNGIVNDRRMPYLKGRSHLVAGELALAAGEAEEARQEIEDAADLFVESSAPYETALARLALAEALSRLGRAEAAEAEALAARDGFAALGATADAERAAQAASGKGGQAAVGDGAPLGELTPREQEVLRLVAQGQSDAEIAEQLVVSPHTVHRHVANVRTKLRLPSRAAAVAYAAREGLI
ncbi:MAG TPA: LuxR C-terminal-related transcriptional regulator [Solirubrobacterales bacterium]|nr:LuxR C-terminal-related transcriptional regulator [Solirubrobacterales bacterium]